MHATYAHRRDDDRWRSSSTFTPSPSQNLTRAAPPPGNTMAAPSTTATTPGGGGGGSGSGSAGGTPPVPRHPLPQMQGAFEESMRETLDDSIQNVKNPYLNADKVQRRKLLLESRKYERTVGGRWMQRRGENFHPLWKLVAQISFGMHLLQSGLARSDEEVIRSLQSHVDEVDGFLERTTEDFELAQHDVNERIRYLRLPLEHGDVFDTMLADKPFRSAIVDGNEKIEHIVNRTTISMKDALKDVQKGLDGTKELKRFLQDLNAKWPTKSHEHEEVLGAMMGNTEGWNDAFKNIQKKGSELGTGLQQLGSVISEIQRRAGVASRRNLPVSNPQDPNQAPSTQPPSGQSTQDSSRQRSKRASMAPQSSRSQPQSQPPSHSHSQSQPLAQYHPHAQVQQPQTQPQSHAQYAPSDDPRPRDAAPQLAPIKISSSLSKGQSRFTPPIMSPIREQDARQGDRGLLTPASGYHGSNRQSQIVSPVQASLPSTSNHSSQHFLVAELPGDSRPASNSHRMSIHQMMTLEALSNKSSAPGSQKSGHPPIAEYDDEGRQEESERDDPFADRQDKTINVYERASIGASDKEVVLPPEIDESAGQVTQEGVEGQAERADETRFHLDPFADEIGADKEAGGTSRASMLHDEIMNSLAAPTLPQAETTPQKAGTTDHSRSPQMEGQTFFNYASSDADTGSVDARSTPGKGRSRSTTNSQPQAPYFQKSMPLGGHLSSEQESAVAPDEEDEEGGVVNHRHPIFQDIRSREAMSDVQRDPPRHEPPALHVSASGESLASEARKNSFRASDSSAKRLSKSELESPVDATASNRDSNATMATPISLRGAGPGPGPGAGGGSGVEGGLRVRDTSRPGSRPKTQVGQAPPIMPHPIQTSGLGAARQDGTAGGDGPPSPSLAELTSATVSGPDAADPFALYSHNNAPKHKHQELLDRLNGALENAKISENANSPTKGGRSASKTHKKSASEMQHQFQSQSQPQDGPSASGGNGNNPTTTTTTTTTTYLDPNSPNVAYTSTSGDNSYTQQTTTSTAMMPAQPAAANAHARSRTLSPFGTGGMMGRNRDRTPEKDSNGEGKRGLKKFFSMKKGKKDTPENF